MPRPRAGMPDAGNAMLVCHCNVIAEKDIREVVQDFQREDPWALIVPAKVYRELGKRGRCCGCFPNVVDIITRLTEEYHLQIADIPADLKPMPESRPAAMRSKRLGGVHERRSAGHRAA